MTKSIDSSILLELFNKGDYLQIINSFDSNMYNPLDDPYLSQLYAAAFFQSGDYQTAFDLLCQVEACFDQNAEFLSMYGACLRRLGRFPESREMLKKALTIKPADASINNNFANLLIDTRDFDEAELILTKLLNDNPEYVDAKENLSRLNICKSTFLEETKFQSLSESSGKVSSWSLADPLLLAFSESEVLGSRQRHKLTLPISESSKQTQELQSLLPDPEASDVALDQLKLANQAIQNKQYEFALKLCSQAKISLPTSSIIYECASDAYIGLAQFVEAEIYLLHSLTLGSSSFKIYANLVSILCMKKDFLLAKFYLEKAKSADPSNSSLSILSAQIKDNLSGFSFQCKDK